ncbi:MAG: MATE family efflux transporter, partial [Clostridia bacterium]|nr:MATE family efflux transporter [Clostridia bacterium]
GDRAFLSQAIRLSLPVAAQNLLISSFALIDTVMVSRLGGTELSSVGMAGQWVWLLNIFLFGIASGCSIFFAQFWGTRDKVGIYKVMGLALLLSLGIMIPFLLLPLFTPEFIISLFNKDAAVVACGSAYLRIALWSYPAIAVNSAVGALLRSTEHVKMPMLVAAITTVANAGLNYVFIFGLGPIPAMGAEGAAVATVISAWLGPVLLILISLLQKNILYAAPRAYLAAKRSDVATYLRRVLPVVLNEALWGAGTLVLTMIWSNVGKEEYGGVTILTSCMNVAFAFLQGIGAACCVMVGKQVGAGKTADAVRDAYRFSILTPLFCVFLGVLIIVFRHPIINLFNMEGGLSQITLATASGLLCIYGVEIAFRNIPYIQICGIMRSGGDALFATLCDVGCLWLFAIPVAFFSVKSGLPFLLCYAMAYVSEDWSKTILCFLRLFSEKWIKPVTEEGKAGLAAYREKKRALKAAKKQIEKCN